MTQMTNDPLVILTSLGSALQTCAEKAAKADELAKEIETAKTANPALPAETPVDLDAAFLILKSGNKPLNLGEGIRQAETLSGLIQHASVRLAGLGSLAHAEGY